MSGLCNAGIAKQVQRPINRGQPEVRIRFGELMVHSLSRNVFLPEKRRQDQLTLAGKFQLVLAQMLLQDVHLFCEFAGGHVSVSHRSPLKTETSGAVKGAIDGVFCACL